MESTNLQTKDDESSDKTDASSSAAALAMMLPQYLQNMLLACGYDRLQIIAEINFIRQVF